MSKNPEIKKEKLMQLFDSIILTTRISNYENFKILKQVRKYIRELTKENTKLLDNWLSAGFIGNGTQIIGEKRYNELIEKEQGL